MDSGAHYFKTDLQVHSPRDPAWSGERPVSAEDRAGYAAAFVAACREKGLRAVAITDHHDVTFFAHIRDAAEQETGPDGEPLPPAERLVVFPGVELTLSVPCQALLILDAEFELQRLSLVLDILGIDGTDPAKSQHDQPIPVSVDTLQDLHDLLDKNTWLVGRYVVLPNVSDRGYQSLMRKGMQAKYIGMPCVGGYLDGSIEKVGTGNAAKFAGSDKAWGNKRIAVFQTSDSRSADFADLGKHSTWIKWATPTAEALRQACLAEESRISHSEPRIPDVVITRLRVSNSQFLGPVEIELNQQYNALIGGRGTGKSSCLEYIRWALCDQAVQGSDDPGGPDHAARRRRLIEQTLRPVEANVEVHFRLHGAPHVVRRYAVDGRLMLKVGAGEMQAATEEDVQALLPIEAYSQRQLSSVGVRVDELLRFVTAPVRDKLDELTAREAELRSAIRTNHARRHRERSLARSIARDQLTLDSLKQQSETLRASLPGLAAEDRDRISAKPGFDSGQQTAASWNRRIERGRTELDRAADAISQLRAEVAPVPTALPHGDVLQVLAERGMEALGQLEADLRAAGNAFDERTGKNSDFGKAAETWEQARGTFEVEYAAATGRATAHKEHLSDLQSLESRQAETESSLRTQQEELQALSEVEEEHLRLRSAWYDVQADRSAIVGEQCERLTELSGGLIRATLSLGTGTAVVQDEFKKAISGSGVRTNKMEQFLSDVVASDRPLKTWHAALDELEERLLAHESGDSQGQPIGPALHAFSATDLDKIAARLTLDAIIGLGVLNIEDEPTFDYQTKEGEHIAFSDASAGQQATALLKVLLNQDGPPLLIDQPEDDLDSQVIQEVVDQIWEAKKRRQIIFASHNANLVVNGDAELVICCDYRVAGDHSGGEIKLQGAIDIENVRKEITAVMEGGERAFRLRKEKYGF